MRMIYLGVFFVGLLGCGANDEAPKTSHFEHDHEIAPHWPTDLPDIAAKIRQRLEWIDTGKTPPIQDDEHGHEHEHGHDDHHGHDEERRHDPEAEITDLIAWAPEIAADTDLLEADWLPVYEACETLRKDLRDAVDVHGTDNRNQIEALCRLIDETSEKIPGHPVSLKAVSP